MHRVKQREREREVENYLTYVTGRELVGEILKKKPLMFACKLICCMNFHITLGTKCCLICTANQGCWCFLTDITLYLHALLDPSLILKIQENKTDCYPRHNYVLLKIIEQRQEIRALGKYKCKEEERDI